jgi:uncharacterized protein (TIGR02266 family)
MTERRQGSRVPVQIWVEEATERELYFQRSANLSNGGIYLENTIPRPVGSHVSLRFSLPGEVEQFQVRAEVVGAVAGEEEMGMGLKFLDLPPSDAERLSSYVTRTAG